MNAAQAKAIPLETFLDRLGHRSVRESNGEFWYRSPLREEQEPSFRVSQRYNNWVDWGTGERGDIIRLAERLFSTDTSGALREIGRVMGERVAFRVVPEQPIETTLPVLDAKIGDLRSFRLLHYLETRGIDGNLAKQHLQEIHYQAVGKPYYAAAFPNDAGGYELRNKFFKGTRGHKDISTRKVGEGKGVAVFEGFLDYLSAIQLNGLPENLGHVVVLNSVALVERGLERIKELKPDAVYLFLDNDPAGDKLVGLMTTRLTCPLVDASLLYEKHKDVNEMLVAQRGRHRPR